MEQYLDRIFDNEKKPNNNPQPDYHQASRTAPTSIEEMAPFASDKRDGVFKSILKRDPLKPSKDIEANPGPGHYDAKKPQNLIANGKK
jgi:hypothetical protein